VFDLVRGGKNRVKSTVRGAVSIDGGQVTSLKKRHLLREKYIGKNYPLTLKTQISRTFFGCWRR
jgi:hypothetical protein